MCCRHNSILLYFKTLFCRHNSILLYFNELCYRHDPILLYFKIVQWIIFTCLSVLCATYFNISRSSLDVAWSFQMLEGIIWECWSIETIHVITLHAAVQWQQNTCVLAVSVVPVAIALAYQSISPGPRLSLRTIRSMIRFYGEDLSAPRPTSNLEDHPLSAVRNCLFNIFAATLHIGGRSSILNLRKHHVWWQGPTYRDRRRWEDNIKMDLQKVGCGGVDWIEMAQNRDRWWALVNAVMNLRVP